MAHIMLQDITVGFGSTLFQNLSFTLNENDRIGVVGDNGSGKTTLLRCIVGQVDPLNGTVIRSSGARIAFVEQNFSEHLLSQSLYQVVLGGIPELERDFLTWKVEMLLDKFETPSEMWERPILQLSGGWKRIALILRAWVSDPDILVIDEPTNDLDLTKIMLLEEWLNQEVKRTPIIMVSHDRSFLDRCTNQTLFLRPIESKMYRHAFSKARELLDSDDRAAEVKKENEMKEIKRLSESAHKLRQIGVNNYSAAALRKSIQIAKRADALKNTLPQTHIEQKRDIQLAGQDTHVKRIVGIRDLTISRPDGVGLFTIGQLDIYVGDRVAVLGRNGTGKTQLVNRLFAGFNNLEQARSDGIYISPSSILGYMDQSITLPDQTTLHDYLRGTFAMNEQSTVSTLVSAGFPRAEQSQKIAKLSLGQRSRLALLILRLTAPNFYLMDEPTNHLDIIGQEQLEDAILMDESTYLLVSHDRTFIDNTGTRFLVVENSRMIEIDSPDIFYHALSKGVNVSDLVQSFQVI